MGVEAPRPALRQPFPALSVPSSPFHAQVISTWAWSWRARGLLPLLCRERVLGTPDFPHSTLPVQNPCPETDAGFLSRLSFWWFTR